VAAVRVGAVRGGAWGSICVPHLRRDQPLHLQRQEEWSRPAVRVYRPWSHFQVDGGAQGSASGALLPQTAPQQPTQIAGVSFQV
jgi:hypothetical protein